MSTRCLAYYFAGNHLLKLFACLLEIRSTSRQSFPSSSPLPSDRPRSGKGFFFAPKVGNETAIVELQIHGSSDGSASSGSSYATIPSSNCKAQIEKTPRCQARITSWFFNCCLSNEVRPPSDNLHAVCTARHSADTNEPLASCWPSAAPCSYAGLNSVNDAGDENCSQLRPRAVLVRECSKLQLCHKYYELHTRCF